MRTDFAPFTIEVIFQNDITHTFSNLIGIEDLIQQIEQRFGISQDRLNFFDVASNNTKSLLYLTETISTQQTLRIFNKNITGTKYTAKGPYENWSVSSPTHYEHQEKVFIRRSQKENNSVVYFLPFDDIHLEEEDKVFVELPFKLTKEEREYIQKSPSNLSSFVPFSLIHNPTYISPLVLRQSKQTVESLLSQLVTLVYLEAYGSEAEEKVRNDKQKLKYFRENDDRVLLKLLASFTDIETKPVLKQWIPIINILSSVLLETHAFLSHNFTSNCIPYQKYFRYIAIWEFFIDLLQNTILKQFESNTDQILSIAFQAKVDLLKSKEVSSIELMKSLGKNILANCTTSVMECTQTNESIEALTRLPWKASSFDNTIKHVAETDFYFFISGDKKISNQIELAHSLDKIQKLKYPHQQIIICCEHVLHLNVLFDHFYPFSAVDICYYLNTLKEEKVMTEGELNKSAYWSKLHFKEVLMKYAEYIPELSEMTEYHSSALETHLKLFYKNQIQFSKEIYLSGQYIHTCTMEALRIVATEYVMKNQFKEIIVTHKPFMGGTTTAREVAFALQHSIPVFLLHKQFYFCKEFASLLHTTLANCSNASILIIADDIYEKEYQLLKQYSQEHRIVLIKFEREEWDSLIDSRIQNSLLEWDMLSCNNLEISAVNERWNRIHKQNKPIHKPIINSEKFVIEKLSKNEKEQLESLLKQFPFVNGTEIPPLGLVYLHEEYYLKYQKLFLQEFQMATNPIQKLFFIISLIRIFAKEKTSILLAILQKLLGISSMQSLDNIFVPNVWLKQFLQCNNGCIDVTHVWIAKTVVSTMHPTVIHDTLKSLIYTGEVNQIIESMIQPWKKQGFSPLIEYLKESAGEVFESALVLNSVLCNAQYCKWLAKYKPENYLKTICRIIKRSEKMNVNRETQSIVNGWYGDAYSEMYTQENSEEVAMNSIDYYLTALKKNRSNIQASVSLARIVLLCLTVNKFDSMFLEKIDNKVGHTLHYLFNAYISQKMKNLSEYSDSKEFTTSFEEVFLKYHPEYKEYLLCQQIISNCEKFELLTKWNVLTSFIQSPTHHLPTITNKEDVIFGLFINLVMNLVNYLNSEDAQYSVEHAYTVLKEKITSDTILPVVYIVPTNKERGTRYVCTCSAPEFTIKKSSVHEHFKRNTHMQIFNLLEEISFVKFSCKDYSALSIRIDYKGNIIVETC